MIQVTTEVSNRMDIESWFEWCKQLDHPCAVIKSRGYYSVWRHGVPAGAEKTHTLPDVYEVVESAHGF